MEASETTATAPPPVPAPEPAPSPGPPEQPAPEAPAPEQPEPGVEPSGEAAPDQPEQPAGEGPDLSDAQADLRAIRSGLERAGLDLGEEQEADPWARLSGAGEPEGQYDEPGYDEYQQQPGEQQQQPLTEEQRYQQQFREAVTEAVRAEVDPLLANLEMERREERIKSFADEHPRMREPEVLDAVEARLQAHARRYGPSALTDPDLLAEAYYAHEARRAASGQQTSTGAAAPEQSAAEAVGQPQGVTLETGAGPGAPPPSADPQEQAFRDAISEADNPWKRSPSAASQ